MKTAQDKLVIHCSLASSGNPIAFSAAGGGTIRFEFDDSQIPGAAALLAWRDMLLQLTIINQGDSTLTQ